MKLVFCGTPEFAVPSLRALVEAGHEVALVLTQPDRAAGRGLGVQTSAVKGVALELGVDILQPERIRVHPELQARLQQIQPDAIVVVAYGRIIPDWMLHLPRFGCINVHGSLLPKYRGAAPIQWALANGETETGVTTMKLDAGLDTGDTLLMQRLPLGPDTTSPEVFPQLSRIGAEVLVETLEGLERGILAPVPQDGSQATLAPILTRDDGRLSLAAHTAMVAYNRWRGFTPWPGAHAILRDKRFLVHRMHPANPLQLAGPQLEPGQLDGTTGELLVGAAQGTLLVLDEVQMEGKPRLAGTMFARQYQLRPGERLG